MLTDSKLPERSINIKIARALDVCGNLRIWG
jgi:hypothetical protein